MELLVLLLAVVLYLVVSLFRGIDVMGGGDLSHLTGANLVDGLSLT